jgi:myo-inositol 2-dehydrogenase / D-chiro-inositol 1-dehydrogenase
VGGAVSPPLSIGLIGAGRMGRLHARLLAGEVEGARLAAVADLDPARAEAAAGAHGVPSLGVAELCQSPGLDAVAICSPTDTHVELVALAAAAGKAVFCEKPISLDLVEANRALEAVGRAGVPLMIGFNRRFDPAHAEVRRAVTDGRVGDPHLLRISSRDPEPPPPAYVAESGGIFLDMTIHDFDIARYVTGSEVAEVFAQGAIRIAPWMAEYDDVDTAVVTLRHENGCLSVIDNSRRAVYGFDQRVEVFGSAGVARVENPLLAPFVFQDAGGGSFGRLHTFFLDRYEESFRLEWQAFIGALRGGQPPPVSGVDAVAPLVIALAAGRSLVEHRPVTTAEIRAEGGLGAARPFRTTGNRSAGG